GIINNFLMTLGVLQHPLPLLYNESAVLLGLVYTYLPVMVLPLYASLERLDRAVREAAADLGATPAECFSKVTLPLTKGGMLCCLVLLSSSLTTPLRSPITFTSPSLVMMSSPCGAMEPPILHPVPVSFPSSSSSEFCAVSLPAPNLNPMLTIGMTFVPSKSW